MKKHLGTFTFLFTSGEYYSLWGTSNSQWTRVNSNSNRTDPLYRRSDARQEPARTVFQTIFTVPGALSFTGMGNGVLNELIFWEQNTIFREWLCRSEKDEWWMNHLVRSNKLKTHRFLKTETNELISFKQNWLHYHFLLNKRFSERFYWKII